MKLVHKPVLKKANGEKIVKMHLTNMKKA